jgi:hypothetical protein
MQRGLDVPVMLGLGSYESSDDDGDEEGPMSSKLKVDGPQAIVPTNLSITVTTGC